MLSARDRPVAIIHQAHLGKWQSMTVARWAPMPGGKGETASSFSLSLAAHVVMTPGFLLVFGWTPVTVSYLGLYLLSLAVVPTFQIDLTLCCGGIANPSEGRHAKQLSHENHRQEIHSSQAQAPFLPRR